MADGQLVIVELAGGHLHARRLTCRGRASASFRGSPAHLGKLLGRLRPDVVVWRSDDLQARELGLAASARAKGRDDHGFVAVGIQASDLPGLSLVELLRAISRKAPAVCCESAEGHGASAANAPPEAGNPEYHLQVDQASDRPVEPPGAAAGPPADPGGAAETAGPVFADEGLPAVGKSRECPQPAAMETAGPTSERAESPPRGSRARKPRETGRAGATAPVHLAEEAPSAGSVAAPATAGPALGPGQLPARAAPAGEAGPVPPPEPSPAGEEVGYGLTGETPVPLPSLAREEAEVGPLGGGDREQEAGSSRSEEPDSPEGRATHQEVFRRLALLMAARARRARPEEDAGGEDSQRAG